MGAPRSEQQSDLLLEYRDDEQLSSSASQRHSHAFNLDEISSATTDSVDTLTLFNLLTNNNKPSQSSSSSRRHPHEELISSDEKMIKVLIKLLVKSCRIFDVATQKTDTRISFWRYANPVVALVKQRSSNSTKLVRSAMCDAAVQTADDGDGALDSGDDESAESEDGNVKTIIEANKRSVTKLNTAGLTLQPSPDSGPVLHQVPLSTTSRF